MLQNPLAVRLYLEWTTGDRPVIRTLSQLERVKHHFIVERLPDWSYGAFLNETDASCVAIGTTREEALLNGQQEMARRESNLRMGRPELYLGQRYFHAHNPVICRAEKNFFGGGFA